MPTDPNIILAAGDIQGPKQPDMMSMYDFAQKVNAARQDAAKKNSLLQIFSDPNSLGPDGSPTPATIKRAWAVDPDVGMKLQDQAVSAQVMKAQQRAAETEVGQKNWDFSTRVAGIGIDAYDEAKKAGKSEADAISAGQIARNEAAKNNGGIVTPEDVDGIVGTKFDPVFARPFADTNKERATRIQQGVKDDLDAKKLKDAEDKEAAAEKARLAQEAEQAKRDDALIAAQSRKDPTATKWEVLTDPTKQVQYRYNPDTYQSTTLDGKPFTPTGAAKLGPGGGAEFTPKIGDLMGALAEQGISPPPGARSKEQQVRLYQGLLDRNPDKTSDEIARMLKTGQIEFGAQKKETQTAAGIAGKVEVAADELKRFIPLVRSASADMKRGNFKSLNQLLQAGDDQISDPKLKTLKGLIVGAMNAYDVLAGRGGSDVGKREESRKQLLSAEGDGAINAALDVIQKESDIAQESAVEATKVPELESSSSSKKKPATAATVDHSKMSDEDLKKKLGIQ